MRQETLDHVLLYGPPGLGKQRSQQLLPIRWAAICVQHLVRRLNVRGFSSDPYGN